MTDEAPPPRRRRWLRWLTGLVLLLLVVAAGGLLVLLNTQLGRDQLVRTLPRLTLESGLGVRMKRITGSIWGQSEIEGLVLTDTKGVFLRADRVSLDWRPLVFLTEKRLDVRRATSPEVRWLRMPELKPTKSETLLPDFDIMIGALVADRLVIEAPVVGRRQLLRLNGEADIKAGRAKLILAADTLETEAGDLEGRGGDRLRLTLDAEPDRDRLILAAALDAPLGGVVLGLLGLEKPLTVRLQGKGGWTNWTGRLRGVAGDAALADVAIIGRGGRFSARGMVAPSILLDGVAARALGPELEIAASIGLGKGPRDLRLRLAGPVLRAALSGRLAEGSEDISDGAIDVRLIDPSAIFDALSGDNIRLRAKVAGSLADPLLDWQLTADAAAWGETRLRTVRAAGLMRPADGGIAIPLTLRVGQISGVGETAEPLLLDVRGQGTLRVKDGRLVGNGLVLRSTRLTSTADVMWRFADGDWRVALNASSKGLALDMLGLPGVGLADVGANVVIVPAGDGARTSGDLRVQMTRLENDGARGVLGGLPLLRSRFVLAPDFSVQLEGLALASPGLTLAGSGALAANGSLRLDARGRLRDYGPLGLVVRGTSAAPLLRLTLDSPGLGVGLTGVTADIAPIDTGWSVVASSASNFGPISLRGEVLTPANGPIGLQVANASVMGLTGSGTATVSAAGPLEGRFNVRGDGLSGRLTLTNAGGVQAIDVIGQAQSATLMMTTPVLIEQGSLRAALRLTSNGLAGTGSFDFKGLERDGVMVDDGSGKLRYADGEGQLTLRASGETGAPFRIESDIKLAKDVIEVAGNGRLGSQSLTLANPARLVRDGADWVLEPVSLEAGGGKASISGRYGKIFRLSARLDKLPLGLVAAVNPNWDFGGRLSGRAELRLDEGSTPRGSLDLTVAALTRNGAAASSLPINVGLVAELGYQGTVARLLVVRAGKVEGRGQVEIGPLRGDGGLLDRFYAASVDGKVVFNGPAQALWGLGGNDALLVGGPVRLAATISGAVGDPRLGGTLTMKDARVEAGLLGTVIEGATLDSRFVGSKLELTRFTGRAGRDGTVSGAGEIDLSAERSFPMDIRLTLDKAKMLDRDDFEGTASGSLRIATDEYGGVVSGKLVVDRATFKIGRASATDVPVLNVTERNVRALGRPRFVYVPATRWLLDLDVRGDRRLFVSGMGIESEWRANLQVKGGAYTPELFGRVELVRGDYDFAGKRFTLTRGDVRFQGGYPPDPLIDIGAESSNSGFTAQLAINGTANKPAIAFSSVPALPQDEVLSRLLFGNSVTNLSAPEAVQLAGALATLRGGSGGFNPINSVRQGLGIDRLRILPADQLAGRGTAVAAGQYIGRDVYVELATDTQGYTATNIEVSITRSLSILSQVATLGGTGAALRWQKDY